MFHAAFASEVNTVSVHIDPDGTTVGVHREGVLTLQVDVVDNAVSDANSKLNKAKAAAKKTADKAAKEQMDTLRSQFQQHAHER